MANVPVASPLPTNKNQAETAKTVYVTRQQYDSIFIWKDRWTHRTHDTVYLKELSTEYRYKLLRNLKTTGEHLCAVRQRTSIFHSKKRFSASF